MCVRAMLRTDPFLTSLQIVALQSWYYLALGAVLEALSLVFDTHRSARVSDLFCAADGAHATTAGLVVVLAHVCVVPLLVSAVVFVVDHRTKVLDFVVTLYIIHVLLSCAVCHGLPLSVQFWATLSVEAVVVVAVAEFVCLRRDAAEVRRLGATLEERDEVDDASGTAERRPLADRSDASVV